MSRRPPPPTPTSRGPRLTAEARRASILGAASEVFAEVGYQRGRVSDVAARLGVSEPVVFQNFGSKAALYAAVLEQAADELCTTLRDAVAITGSVNEVLTQILSPGHLDQMHARGAPGVLFADAVGLTADGDVADAARHALRRVATTIAELLADGQQAGTVRPELDPTAAAWTLLSFMASHGFRTAVMPNRKKLEAQLARQMLELLTGDPT